MLPVAQINSFMNACVLFALVFVYSAVNAETLILYYEKQADQNRVNIALEKIERSLRGRVYVVTAPSNPFYEEKGLPTNTVMCGSLVDKDELKLVVEKLVAQKVQVRYVGPYTRRELNSSRNTIDIRAIGDDTFSDTYEALEVSEIDWDEIDCGYGDGKIGVSRHKPR